MAGVVWALLPVLGVREGSGGSLLIPYAVVLAAAVAAFVAVAALTRHPELREIVGLFRRRAGR